MENSNLDKIKKARKYKILPHRYLEEYDQSLWVDGNFMILNDINKFIKKFAKQTSMMCIAHPDRECIYEEAEVCIKVKKDSEEIISKQINKYSLEKYPPNNGLIASGILYRKHNDPQVIKLMEDWWKEVKLHSRRDQLSYNYVCWKNRFHYDECDLLYWNNKYFNRLEHK
ncbi:DUF616 domain-containing protein [Methanobacterium alcaliphilum]|nr:DUF616 domain-containing protein [Methanobacterium alcaliphilum]